MLHRDLSQFLCPQQSSKLKQKNHTSSRGVDTNELRAGAVILDKDAQQCLMVFQRKSKLWGIPKGRKNLRESYKNCMYREVMEETGMNLKDYDYECIGDLMIHNKCMIYIIKLKCDELPVCNPPKENGKKNHEIVTVEWTSLDVAFSRHVNSITRIALQDIRGRIENIRDNYDNKSTELIIDGCRIHIPQDIKEMIMAR